METHAPTWAAGLQAIWAGPRCGAYARTHGGPCRNGAMANGRCQMHGGKNPGAPLGNTNAFVTGCYSARVIAETAPLYEKANALMVEAIRARSDVARKLLRGELPPEEAEKRYEAIRAWIAEAFALRKEAISLKYTWLDRDRRQRKA